MAIAKASGNQPGRRATPQWPGGLPGSGGGTISSYDRDGERLLSRCMARMPEAHQATLKSQLTAEGMGALIQRPDLRVVKLADGAADNWSYLSDPLPVGDECLDFYHASEPLSEALAAAYGQAILTFRAWCQSERFERAWELLVATYKRPVGLPRKVMALNQHR